MGMSSDTADASLRLSVGRFTTDAQVDEAAARILEAVIGVRDRIGSISEGRVSVG
jgi:cysteine sulfinate desulfinase/cysteine desulfurase-like protein